MRSNKFNSLSIGVILGIFYPTIMASAVLAGGPTAWVDERGEWSNPSLQETTLPQPAGEAWGIGGVSGSPSAKVAISPGWGVYEDWSSPYIRSDRWIVDTGRAHEARREVLGHHLLMRLRLEGSTLSNVGFRAANHVIRASNPSEIRMIEADFQVENYAVVGCWENQKPTGTGTRVRPVQVSLPGFNDGSSSGSGDSTGDYFLRIMVNREDFPADPPGMLTVQAFLFRCIDAVCSNAISTSPHFNLDMGKVMVGKQFSLRAIWDEPGNRYLVGFNNNPDVIFDYDPGWNQKPMGFPFADIRMQSVNANCLAGPTVTDSETKVREVHTNTSAVIP